MSRLESAESADASQQQQTPNQSREQNQGALIRLETDFAEDGRFGRRIFEVTGDLIRVSEPNGALSFQMPISGGPSWIDSDRYRIDAKAAERVNVE